jgi:hypothetical protein
LAEDKPKTKGLDRNMALTLPFSKISSAAAYEVEIVAAPIASAVAHGDMPGLELVTATVVGDTLYISQNAPIMGVKIKEIKAKLTVYVPILSSLESIGAGKVTVKKLRAGDFKLSQRSRNEVKFEDVKLGKLAVFVDDETRVKLSGQCDVITVEAMMGGTIDAEDLHCAEATVALAHKAEASVRARNKITAQLDGTGTLKVKDKPSDITVTLRNRTDVDFEN